MSNDTTPVGARATASSTETLCGCASLNWPNTNDPRSADLVQQIVDMRRGADLLLTRADVDPHRLAYVGHSYNATVGGFLAGVDKRFRAFVLMAGNLSDEVDKQSKEYQEFRRKFGAEKFDAFQAKYTWLDPGKYVSHASPVRGVSAIWCARGLLESRSGAGVCGDRQ